MVCGMESLYTKQVFRVKKLVGRRGAPELELLAVVIVLFAPILHESLTNSNFVTNYLIPVRHSNSAIWSGIVR